MKIFGKRKRDILYPMPVLDCDRLELRPMRVNDAEDMYEYAKLEEVTKYLLWSPHESLSYTESYLSYVQSRYRDGAFYDWAIVLKEEYKMIGTCGFTKIDRENNSGEIGYVINPAYSGKGYACEAVRRVLELAFNELNLNRIEAKYIIGNDASFRVMEKCNMKSEGTARESMKVKGEYKDIGTCAILKTEYMQKEIID